MWRSRRLHLLLGLWLLLGAAGCAQDDEDPLRYDLVVFNNRAEQYDLYRRAPELSGNEEFVRVGTVRANASFVVRRLLIEIEYTFRTTAVGAPPAQFVDERTVSSGGDNRTWTLR